MLKLVNYIGVGLVVVLAGCGDATGPTELGGYYQLALADGQAVPVRSFTSVSNEAGSCAYDLTDGAATFSDQGQYTLSFSYDVRCTGSANTTRSHNLTNGTYSRSGNRLTLTPQVQGTFTVQSVEIQSGRITVRTRSNAGEEHTFRFTEVSF